LRAHDLPTTYGDWSDYARFAVTFSPRDRESCAEFAASAFANWRRTSEVPRALQELRACLWFEQRRWRFMGRAPDAEGMQEAAASDIGWAAARCAGTLEAWRTAPRAGGRARRARAAWAATGARARSRRGRRAA